MAKFFTDLGLAYPISIVVAGFVAGIWSVSFWASIRQGQGVLPHPHHHGGTVHNRRFHSDPVREPDRRKRPSFFTAPGTIKVGPLGHRQ